MRKLKKVLSIILTAVLILGIAGINPVDIRADGEKTITLKLSCSDEVKTAGNVPENYGINITTYSGEEESGVHHHRIAGNADGSLVTETISIPVDCTKIVVQVENPGLFVEYNGEIDNDWGGYTGKTLGMSDIVSGTEYAFVLQPEAPEGPFTLPEELFTEKDGKKVLTITDSNKDTIAAYNGFLLPFDHEIDIETNFVISGNIDFDFGSTIKINKGCSITAGSINFVGVANVILGDKGSLAGLGISPDIVKIKKTGDETLYPFDVDTINNTEFSFENEALIYKDGPDCGFGLSSNGSCYDKEANKQYGIVEYKVYTDGELVKKGTLNRDFANVDVPKEKFKEGTRIDFVVKSFEGKILQSNGVRFPDNKTYISTAEEEAKVGTEAGCTCSYTLTETPNKYLAVFADFISAEEKQTTADFAWSYDTRVTVSDGGFDKLVEHGTIEVLSAEGATNTNDPATAPYWTTKDNVVHVKDAHNNEWDEMQGKFAPGTKVTVRLIPERGYQLTKFTISNIPRSTTPVDGVNEYTFNLPRADFFHLAATFSKIPDEVDTDRASGVSGGSISTIYAGDVNAGTVALNVEDVTPDSAEQSKFKEMASEGGYTVDQTLSIGVEQRFYKGVENATRDQCWVQSISQTLTADADIKLNVSGITGSEVEVLHNHGGSYEIIPATYSNGVLSFKTKSFSDFAIVSKGAKPAPSTPSSSSSSDSKSEEEVAPVVSKPTTLGTVVGGTTVRNWDDLEKVMATKTVASAKTKAEKTAAKAPIVLVLNQRNATVPVSTIQALQKSDASSLHLMLGNGAAITISNGAGLKNQGAINLASKVTQTKNSKTITFNANTKLLTLGALHMSVPKNVTEAKLYYVLNRQSVYLGTFKPVNGQVFFPINQLGTYQLVY